MDAFDFSFESILDWLPAEGGIERCEMGDIISL